MPADWPETWAALLLARAQPDSAEAAAAVTAPCSAASAAWRAVYLPLLHARQAAGACGPQPWALAQLGQSLDGCVATASGDSYFVTGPQSLLHLHRLRALCDAVLVGAGTVAADDPQLTTRRVPGPHAVRVVLDPAARLDGRARLFHDGQAPTMWLCDSRHAGAAAARLAGMGVAGAARAEVLAVPGLLPEADAGRSPDMPRAFAALAARGLGVLLVEGGGVTVSRCLQAGLLQRLHLVLAPVLIGAGRRGLQQPSPLRMADCLRPPAQRMALGDDLLWDLDLGQAAVRDGHVPSAAGAGPLPSAAGAGLLP